MLEGITKHLRITYIILFLIVIGIFLLIYNPDMLDKSTSYITRRESIINLYYILEMYPGGMSNEELYTSQITPTDTLFLHYALRNGYFGILTILIFGIIILRRTMLLAKSKNSLELTLSASIISLFFFQLLMGNLFEFQFLLFKNC